MDIFEKYVGQVFDRRYKIKKIIGMGGMAVVFEAYDMLKNRPVAVKMLKDDISGDTQAVKRFINESKAVAMLSHPNIVSIFDVSVKDNLKYIVMELIEGITLKNYMQKKGDLSFKEVVSISEQILRALEHAHSKGIVHRDIKPQNIMLLKDGSIKVADFGIAKLPNAETVTMTDKAIGTVFYISPEQASGKPIDHRSDLYSLGATMYEMATGKLPFTAESPVSVALMQVKSIPQKPREYNQSIPRGLEQIILIAMEKNPAHRFQSASQMLRHLLQIKNNPKAVFKVTEHSPEGENAFNQNTNQNKKSTKVQSRSMFPIIMGITTAFLIVAAISAVTIISALLEATSDSNSISVEIPGLVGSLYSEELSAQLENNHYEIIKETVFDSSAANTIIEQEPKEGEKRKVIPGEQNCELKLTISLGPETIELDDYKYMYRYDAEIALKALGFKNIVYEEAYHDYIPESYIISSDPAAKTTVKKDDVIKLTVSAGQNKEENMVTVPDFTEKSEAAAKLLLSQEKLKLGSVKYIESASEKGTILEQSLSPMTKVNKGTLISFTVSLGPAKPVQADTKEADTQMPEETEDDTQESETEESLVPEWINI